MVFTAGVVLPAGVYAASPPTHTPDADTGMKGVDLRPIFNQWGLSPRCQGERKTCSVFTVVGALEYALAKKEGRAHRLSVEFLNWAANRVMRNARDGAFFADIWRGFTAYGVCPEEDMPHQKEFDPWQFPSTKAREHARLMHQFGFRLHWIKRWNPTTGLSDAQFRKIKEVLRRRWPVCAGLRWPKDEFIQWKDEVLQMVPPEETKDGHSVLLVGYRDDARQPGGGVLIFRNSSNEGRDGYMTYQYARRYTNDSVWIDYKTKAAASPAPSLRDVLGPLGAAPLGRNRRVSSNHQPGWNTENLDMNWLMPGESVKMPVLEGPGVITHIWFTSHAGWVGELNSLTLRIYYDDSQRPGVEVPLGDFFAVGHGKPAVVNSIPVQVSPTGSLSSYWRMPFRKNCRIEVTNDNTDRSTGLYWQVDWVQLEKLPPKTPYFYARYRQEHPAGKGDYLIADLQGRGYYVGTVMSVTLAQDGWFGEGDDFFYIDGEEVPSLQGTGSEDYFNDAWGFRPRTGPWFGQPRWQGYDAGDCGVCYRWHLLDPVRFTGSLRATIEHKGNAPESEDGFYLERPDFFSSVAFWYQTGRPKASFPPLPSWRQRRVPWQHHHLVKTYRRAEVSGKTKVQVEAQGFFGARPALVWPNNEPDAVLTLPFTLAETGSYAARLTAAKGPGYGVYDVELDEKKICTADFRAPYDAEADVALGTLELKKGEHTIAFRATHNAAEVDPLGVEILRFLKLPPEVKRDEKTHHEAHFIRLGIGRALYAYRLAHDELPDSLETLVSSGFMPERYLKDENERPLRAWRKGDAMVVGSPGKGGWKHSWQGLDARR